MSNKKESTAFNKRPDWDYLEKKYPEDINNLKSYWGGRGQWSIVDCSKMQLSPDTNKSWLTVGQGKGFGFMACGLHVLKSADLNIGDVLDYDSVYIVTLVNRFYNDEIIYRVTNVPIEIHKKFDDVKAECSRLQTIIDKEDTFRGCFRLY